MSRLDVGDYMLLTGLVFAICGGFTGDTTFFVAFAILWAASALRVKT